MDLRGPSHHMVAPLCHFFRGSCLSTSCQPPRSRQILGEDNSPTASACPCGCSALGRWAPWWTSWPHHPDTGHCQDDRRFLLLPFTTLNWKRQLQWAVFRHQNCQGAKGLQRVINQTPLLLRGPKPGFLIQGSSQPRLMGFPSSSSVSWSPSLYSASCVSLRLVQVWCSPHPTGAQLP